MNRYFKELLCRHKWKWNSHLPGHNVRCEKCGKKDTWMTMGG